MNELYNRTNTCKVVKTGVYKDVRYWITTMGTHPCAYVECPKEFLNDHLNEYGDIDGIYAHGGVTFTGELKSLKAFFGKMCYDGKYFYSSGNHINFNDAYAFGWDYNHCTDWAGNRSNKDNNKFGYKKWEIDEIELECHNAINTYLALVEVDKNKVDETKLVILKNRDLFGWGEGEMDLGFYDEGEDYMVKTFETKEERDGYIKALCDFHLKVEMVYGDELKKITL